MITTLAAAIVTNLGTSYESVSSRRAYVESLEAHELEPGEIEAIVTPAAIEVADGSRAADLLTYQINLTLRTILAADETATSQDAVLALAEGMIPHFYRLKLAGAICTTATLEQVYLQEEVQQASLFCARLRLTWRA